MLVPRTARTILPTSEFFLRHLPFTNLSRRCSNFSLVCWEIFQILTLFFFSVLKLLQRCLCSPTLCVIIFYQQNNFRWTSTNLCSILIWLSLVVGCPHRHSHSQVISEWTIQKGFGWWKQKCILSINKLVCFGFNSNFKQWYRCYYSYIGCLSYTQVWPYFWWFGD